MSCNVLIRKKGWEETQRRAADTKGKGHIIMEAIISDASAIKRMPRIAGSP